MSTTEELFVGLDIGTSKIAVVVAELAQDNTFNIIGVGRTPSSGLREGSIVNIDETVSSIKQAITEAEGCAGCQIHSAYINIGGEHIKGELAFGMVSIKKNANVQEVTAEDILEVNNIAKNIPLDPGRQVVQLHPNEYIVGNQDGIQDPRGISGTRLECKAHAITASSTALDNIIKCAERCELHVLEIIPGSLAAAHALLSEDEKELGVTLIDIGGGTTDIIVFENSQIIYTASLPIGGEYITKDIATGLCTPKKAAELIKKNYGSVTNQQIGADTLIEVPSVGGRPPQKQPRNRLVDIISPRAEEMLETVWDNIQPLFTGREATNVTAAGVVLTGGTTQLDGLTELAEEIFRLPTRQGTPNNLAGLQDLVDSPEYATSIGLIRYGADTAKNTLSSHFENPTTLGRVKNWFSNVF